MPVMPGLVAMPSVLMNAAFSAVPDRSWAVHSRDTLAVVSPMYNEEKGAERALRSLLEQSAPPEQIAVSINGGSDDTYGVVTRLLGAEGYTCLEASQVPGLAAHVEEWLSPAHISRVTLLVYREKTAKAVSVNALVVGGYVTADRVLVVDGDTVFHPDFVRELRANFYRVHVRRVGGRQEVVLEDYALQSGSVTSFAPPGSSLRQRFISAGRRAEYAFAGALRAGQSRQLGRGRLFGASRLYTVIGCGFAARRELFPMPVDTETEDHDFTLLAQSQPERLERHTPASLAARGFRFVVAGLLRCPTELFDAQDDITLKRGASARFVERALMATEDPPHFNGFIRQVERWNGGAQQAVLKRLGARLSPNAGFALWLALAENLVGLTVLAALPILLALNYGNPSLGLTWLMLLAWFGLDLLVTGSLVAYGFYRRSRAEGLRAHRALPAALQRALLSMPPFLALRVVNPITYVASATRVLPAYFRQRAGSSGVVWERSHIRRRTRSEGVFAATAGGMAVCVGVSVGVAPYINPVNAEAWRLTYGSHHVDMAHYEGAPFVVKVEVKFPQALPSRDGEEISPRVDGKFPQALPGWDGEEPSPGASLNEPEEPRVTPAARTLSRHCDPSWVAGAAPEARQLAGDPAAYVPLSRWGLMTLARLAPVLPYLEAAATAYDVSPVLYLQILLNESYLDPLAVGPDDDKGLSQVTSDALTMLRALAHDEGGRYYNPRLFPESFSVFDPDFSLCAGAAKLAWASHQPGVSTDEAAYALYINPLHGFVNGRISERHQPLTAAMTRLENMALALAHTVAAYRADPGRVSAAERALLGAAAQVAEGRLTLAQAYRLSYAVVQDERLADEAMYRELFARYFGDDTLAVGMP